MEKQNEARIDALEAVELAFSALVCNPCDFPHAEVFSCLRTRLLKSVFDEETLKIVVDCIFNQCIQRNDIQMSGAQMCTYLSANLNCAELTTTFRAVFLKRCQAMYAVRNELVESYQGRKELINFTKFMTQIMLHMKLQDGSVMEPFPQVVLDLLRTLMNAVSKETIQCVNQVLRNSGSVLEQQAKQKPDLDELFNTFRDTYLENVLQPEQQKILLKLILLRNLKWIPNDICSDITNN